MKTVRPYDPRRRRFLQAATTAAGGALSSCGGSKSPWRFLTAPEAETAAAVCERIIPADEYPGAAWAGAVNYIDRQLSGSLRRFRQTYRKGLAGIDQTAREMFQERFAALAVPRQIEVLKRLESGRAPGAAWKDSPPKQFFDLIVAHTMQSYYGDPRHGGNRDAVGWRSIGLPLTPVRGRSQHDLTKAPGERS